MPTSPRGEWYPFGTTLRRICNVGKGRCGHRPLRKRLKLMTLPPGGRYCVALILTNSNLSGCQGKPIRKFLNHPRRGYHILYLISDISYLHRVSPRSVQVLPPFLTTLHGGTYSPSPGRRACCPFPWGSRCRGRRPARGGPRRAPGTRYRSPAGLPPPAAGPGWRR